MRTFLISPNGRPIAIVTGSGIVTAGLLCCSIARSTLVKTAADGESSHQVSQSLDGIMQPRFQELIGNFGMSRIATSVQYGHDVARFRAKTPAEKQLLQEADSPGLNYAVLLLHCAPVPGQNPAPVRTFQPRSGGGLQFRPSLAPPQFHGQGFARLPPLQLPSNFKPYLTPLFFKQPIPVQSAAPAPPSGARVYTTLDGSTQETFLKAANDKLPDLMKGENAEATTGSWLVVMRPIPAKTASCTGCHSGAKIGDTLGVMVYGVKQGADRTDSTGG